MDIEMGDNGGAGADETSEESGSAVDVVLAGMALVVFELCMSNNGLGEFA